VQQESNVQESSKNLVINSQPPQVNVDSPNPAADTLQPSHTVLSKSDVFSKDLSELEIEVVKKEAVISMNKKPKALGAIYILYMEPKKISEIKKWLIDTVHIKKDFIVDIDCVDKGVYEVVTSVDAIPVIKQFLRNLGFEVHNSYKRHEPRVKKAPKPVWEQVKAKAIKKMAKNLWWAKYKTSNKALELLRYAQVEAIGGDFERQVLSTVEVIKTNPDKYVYNRQAEKTPDVDQPTQEATNPSSSIQSVIIENDYEDELYGMFYLY
jgi:hypothetical protein